MRKMEMSNDTRIWRIMSEYLANDPEPYSTQVIMDYADECNCDNVNDEDWKPFELVDAGDEIHDLSHQRGNEGYLAAQLWNQDDDGPAVLDAESLTGARRL
jgi:hypothetical protein